MEPLPRGRAAAGRIALMASRLEFPGPGRLSNEPYKGLLWLLMVAYREILAGLTKSTDHPSRGLDNSVGYFKSLQGWYNVRIDVKNGRLLESRCLERQGT